MIPTPPPQVPVPPPPIDQVTIDQLAQNILLTAQAVQRLHVSFDRKFTGSP